MKNNSIEEIFKELDFDIAEPAAGHQERFLSKLKSKPADKQWGGKLRMLWNPLFAVAASFLILFMVAGSFMGSGLLTQQGDLAGVSPELRETHEFYTNLIKSELARVNEVKTPETEAIAEDAFRQLEILDLEYEKLKKDLKTSGQDKRVVFAMVSNLQQRIDVLNNVLIHIENITQLKNQNNEINIL